MSVKMEEGDLFAIETFGSINGRARVSEDMECSHYARDDSTGPVAVRNQKAKELLHHINQRYNGLTAGTAQSLSAGGIWTATAARSTAWRSRASVTWALCGPTHRWWMSAVATQLSTNIPSFFAPPAKRFSPGVMTTEVQGINPSSANWQILQTSF